MWVSFIIKLSKLFSRWIIYGYQSYFATLRKLYNFLSKVLHENIENDKTSPNDIKGKGKRIEGIRNGECGGERGGGCGKNP